MPQPTTLLPLPLFFFPHGLSSHHEFTIPVNPLPCAPRATFPEICTEVPWQRLSSVELLHTGWDTWRRKSKADSEQNHDDPESSSVLSNDPSLSASVSHLTSSWPVGKFLEWFSKLPRPRASTTPQAANAVSWCLTLQEQLLGPDYLRPTLSYLVNTPMTSFYFVTIKLHTTLYDIAWE